MFSCMKHGWNHLFYECPSCQGVTVTSETKTIMTSSGDKMGDKPREFDYKALYESYPEMNLGDLNSYGLVEAGARWQFKQDEQVYQSLLEFNKELVEALEKIEDVNSALKDNSMRARHQSYADWELRRIARSALDSAKAKIVKG